MKNIDIEKFYSKTTGHPALLAAYSQNFNLPKIIKSCRLKPHSVFEKGFEFSTKLENHWVDEFGNSLYITPDNISIKLNDLTNHENSKVCTDLFYGNSIKATARNSKQILIAGGTDLLSDDNFFLVSFYGVDEYFRTFIFMQSTWTRVSPLMMGVKTMVKFFSSANNQWGCELNKKDLDFVIPFNISKCIITSQKEDIGSYFNNKIINDIGSDS